ncbi:kinase-like protein [Panus rudis PR-1116 ss-1]|nr:kinase-like protein [Panus rudis PR-1116 ss-1]
MGQKVALKRLRYFVNMTQEQKEQNGMDFAREALLWHQMRHSNVVPLLGVDVESFGGMPCMVLPWIERGNIMLYLLGKKNRPTLAEVAAGLSYLHDQMVIHGDLRGWNILITDDGVAQLSDFGLSVFANERSKSFRSLRGGVEQWLAPEILDPEQYGKTSSRPTYTSDVFAFGMVCIELYTQQQPFPDLTTSHQIRKRILDRGRPERPILMSDTVWSLTTACWDHDPANRPRIRSVLKTMESIPGS